MFYGVGITLVMFITTIAKDITTKVTRALFIFKFFMVYPF